jgi:hypothetical protein
MSELSLSALCRLSAEDLALLTKPLPTATRLPRPIAAAIGDSRVNRLRLQVAISQSVIAENGLVHENSMCMA